MQPQQPQQPQGPATAGADASADNEVMAILSSPGQQKKFVVKPQPRPGGGGSGAVAAAAAGGSGALGPTSPRVNGNAFVPPSSTAFGDDYHRDTIAVAIAAGGRGGAVEASSRGGGVIGVVVEPAGSGLSPPKTPGLPKSTSASWDPQVQSSSSAFSVPAGRGGGGGGGAGRGEGLVGVGGGGAGGIGSLSLGGFRSVGGAGGGEHFQVRWALRALQDGSRGICWIIFFSRLVGRTRIGAALFCSWYDITAAEGGAR